MNAQLLGPATPLACRRDADALPPVMTVEQFAMLYGLGRTRVFAEIAAGRLNAMKFGRNTRIARCDAEDWLEARRKEAGLPPRAA